MGTPIESSSLVFKTREFYLSGSTDSAKGSTLTFEELDTTLIFLSRSIAENTGSGGPGIYNSAFYPNTTVPATVGGITINTSVNDLEGETFSEMFDRLLFPTIDPTAQPAGGASTTIAVGAGTGGTGAIREVGVPVNVDLTTTFTQGKWKAGSIVVTERDYYGEANDYIFISGSTTIDNNLDNTYTFSNHVVAPGDNSFSTQVSYDPGDQPVDSKGDNFGSPNPAGTTSLETDSFTGVYPILYGMSATNYLSSGDIYADAGIDKAIISKPTTPYSLPLNGTNLYVYIAYPDTYGGAILKDQNGFSIASYFINTRIITSPYWSTSYVIYRSPSPTTVNNASFTIDF
jgi:hypothetical protein